MPKLIIDRVPKETLRQFEELLSSSEFSCENNKKGYGGFLLKTLIDFYIGKIPNGVQELHEEVMLLTERVYGVEEKIENKRESKTENKKIIRSVSGDRLHIRSDENE